MILTEEVSRNWEREGEWRIAPACFTWIAEGNRIVVGNGTIIGDYACIGNYAHIGSRVRIGNCVSIGNDTNISDDTNIGDGTRIGDYVHVGNSTRIGSSVRIDNGAHIGANVSIGNDTNISDGARIGDRASEVIDLGFADGFRKCLANVNGVAYIGAGCRWFTLDEAIKHWESHNKNRDLTLCLMQSAIHIAGLRGWAFSQGEVQAPIVETSHLTTAN